MAFTEQDYQEIVARLKRESQGVGDVPNAESLDGITSLPAYQPAEGQDMPRIVRAPLALLAAPALEAARVANEAAGTANEKAQLAQDAADNAYNTNMGIAFTRTNSENMAAPAGGSFENPVPDGPVWTSAIPAGMGRLWVSMRKFTSNGINQDAAWSAPANLTYNQYLEFATSTVMDNPGTPDTNPENWVDKGGNGYVWIGIQMVYNGSKKGWNVTRVTPDLRELISSMETSVSSAYSAAAAAGRATADANAAATAANEKVALAAAAAASANDTADHPTYIGTDHYVYKWNKATKSYDKTDIYCKGDAFSVKKVYTSVAAMEADKDNPDIAEGDFVMVNTSDVEDPDNAKLYVKGDGGYEFLVDMSGAIGFTGKTPQFSMGAVSTLEAGASATATISEDGTDEGGNPKYKINFAIPRGTPGAPFRPVGQFDTLELLKQAIPDGATVGGMIAVGTEAPYDYYAWLNGDWINQGKVVGGGDSIVKIPAEVILSLSDSSTSEEILAAFGGKNKFIEICNTLIAKPAVFVSHASQDTMGISVTFAATGGYDSGMYVISLISADMNRQITIMLEGDNAAFSSSDIFNYISEAPKNNYSYMRKNGNWEAYKPPVIPEQKSEVYTLEPTRIDEENRWIYIDEIKFNGLVDAINNKKIINASLNFLKFKSFWHDASMNNVYVPCSNAYVTDDDHIVLRLYESQTYREAPRLYAVYITFSRNSAYSASIQDSVYLPAVSVLSKSNTMSYTPSSDYHPATKKYVDDKTKTLFYQSVWQRSIYNEDSVNIGAFTGNYFVDVLFMDTSNNSLFSAGCILKKSNEQVSFRDIGSARYSDNQIIVTTNSENIKIENINVINFH